MCVSMGRQLGRPHATRRKRMSTAVAVFGALWVVLCLLLVSLRFSPPRGDAPADSNETRSMPVFDPRLKNSESLATAAEGGEPTMSLVESLPVGDFSLESAAPQTFEALTTHVQTAKTSIDLSAMYWNLLGKMDREVYTDAEMRRFGAARGQKLLQALHDAATRGVKLRILTASQKIGEEEEESASAISATRNKTSSCAKLPDEVQMLVNAAPDKVQVRCWSGPNWYGSGILHQKIWVFDARHVYVGSANMDWKSLAQVMEVGVLMEHLPSTSPVIQDMQRLFDTWWLFASPALLPAKTATYYSETFQQHLQVPAWSLYLPERKREADPFVAAGLSSLSNISHQIHQDFRPRSADNNSSSPDKPSAVPGQLFVAAAPLEATAAHSRAFDEDALVYTIRSATSRVSLSVMDFAPYSMYTPEPLYWPALTDALLAGLYSKPGLQVRLLISQWQHTSPQMLKALDTLDKQAALCKQMRTRCTGKLEIKLFRVPGWNTTTSTTASKAQWPSYTRVNHAKYIVTDARANIGTSNMEWGYFFSTAGASVNTDHEPTRKALKTLFDRNWNSSYAQLLGEVLTD